MHRLKNLKQGDKVRVCIPLTATIVGIVRDGEPFVRLRCDDPEIGIQDIRLIDYLTIEKIEHKPNYKPIVPHGEVVMSHGYAIGIKSNE